MLVFLANGAVDTAAAPYSSATSVIVAILATTLSVLAFRAASKRGNPGLRWVGSAFVVFAIKNLFSAYNVTTHFVAHDDIELGLSIGDLIILILLFMPLLHRKRRG
ncbi:MAG: hypothetical protein WDA16_00140 [Candidatus Thermoplasmatota archaeon]